MASSERDLRKLSDRELDSLSQEALAEQIRRIEEDPNAIVVTGSSPIEEDSKALDTIANKTNNSK